MQSRPVFYITNRVKWAQLADRKKTIQVERTKCVAGDVSFGGCEQNNSKKSENKPATTTTTTENTHNNLFCLGQLWRKRILSVNNGM